MTIVEARAAAHKTVGEQLCLDPDRDGHTTECDRVYAVVVATYAAAMCESIDAIQGERLEDPQTDDDDAYQRALVDAVNAVRRLQQEIV